MLSIVSTPIGNLGDITLRAIETLKQCDAIVCEDTRVTGNLLKQLTIPKKELISCHSYTTPQNIEGVIRRLKDGEHLAMVSDAGTPGISDPGYALVSRMHDEGIRMEVIPGPSAFLTALSGSGLPINTFTYYGFPPAKKGRQTWFSHLHDEDRTVVFYESVHRMTNAIQCIENVLQDQPDRIIIIARELTKMHEEIIHTTVKDLPTLNLTLKGEFVIVIAPNSLSRSRS